MEPTQGTGEPGTSSREGGVDRLIDLAEQALAAGDEAQAFSLATQARVLSPGDIRIQRIFQAEAAARSWRPTLLTVLGTMVILAVLAGTVSAFLSR